MLNRLETLHPALPPLLGLLILLAAAALAGYLARRVLETLARALASRTEASWDDRLLAHGVFRRLAQVLPALLVFAGIGLVPALPDFVDQLVRNVTTAYLVLMVTLALSATIAAAQDIYSDLPIARERPLKGLFQLLQILAWLVGGVLVIAALMDRSPLLLLSGLGAVSAVLMLVFKDTILGLVASVQLTANDMVRVGDWIEMPQYGADGDVIDVSLHTIKVQNWDKTITTIPTWKLIAESFKNWRGMTAAGGRRIKRALYIDQHSIRFLSDDEVEHFKRFALLKDYIARKEQELRDYNARLKYATEAEVNKRRLTNIGTFRAYVLNYLRNHPQIHQSGMTLLVRQLPPGPEGLPLEIYCFTRTTAWAEYENIQSDIFDHLLAVAPEFGLRIYQKPAGTDLRALAAERPA
ncbi:MAG: mechanosensitive ion channel family protein [Gammaproteobacteria bacterium]|nr:MAG: mechanosensitive ion channel family protein [Gammaproteobacteria bacterium]